MPNGTYGGVRGRKTKVGRKLLFPRINRNPGVKAVFELVRVLEIRDNIVTFVIVFKNYNYDENNSIIYSD